MIPAKAIVLLLSGAIGLGWTCGEGTKKYIFVTAQ